MIRGCVLVLAIAACTESSPVGAPDERAVAASGATATAAPAPPSTAGPSLDVSLAFVKDGKPRPSVTLAAILAFVAFLATRVAHDPALERAPKPGTGRFRRTEVTAAPEPVA